MVRPRAASVVARGFRMKLRRTAVTWVTAVRPRREPARRAQRILLVGGAHDVEVSENADRAARPGR